MNIDMLDEALDAYQHVKIQFKQYHDRLRIYMNTCLKDCRVPTWEEWNENLQQKEVKQ